MRSVELLEYHRICLRLREASGFDRFTCYVRMTGRLSLCLDSVQMPDENQLGVGSVELSGVLNFVGEEHEDGPGWECFSSKEGRSLVNPHISIDGIELTLKQAADACDALESGGLTPEDLWPSLSEKAVALIGYVETDQHV